MSTSAGTGMPESAVDILPPVAARQAAARRRHSPTALALRFAPILLPWFMLAGLLAIYGSLQEGVWSLDELNIQSAATLTLLLVATGQTIVILTGGIDLSVGGILSLSTALAATQFGEGGSRMFGWILAVLALGAVAGAANGILISVLRLQPFIVTLATWSIWSGIALWVLPIEGGQIPESFFTWVDKTKFGLASPAWLLFGLILFWLWFKRTRLGVWIRAVGSSESSAFLSGVPTGLVTTAAYALSGLFAAFAGLFLTTQTAAGSPTVGNEFILSSVAAVVIGGTSLFGGRGGLGGTIAGAFILTLIGSVIFVLNIESFWTPIVTGLLLIFAVLANSLAEIYVRRRGLR